MEESKFQEGHSSLKFLVEQWGLIHTATVSALLSNEIAERKVLNAIILMVHRRQVMDHIFDLASLLYLHATDDEIRQKLGRVIEMMDAQMNSDDEETQKAQFLN